MCVRSLSREDLLEEGMAAHSSILTWRIPWTEEPGGLQSMGSQRVNDWSDWAGTHICIARTFSPGESHCESHCMSFNQQSSGWSDWGPATVWYLECRSGLVQSIRGRTCPSSVLSQSTSWLPLSSAPTSWSSSTIFSGTPVKCPLVTEELKDFSSTVSWQFTTSRECCYMWASRRHFVVNIRRQCVRACWLLQSCPTVCEPVDCSPPGSSVHGILQARLLEWIAMPSSKGSSWPRDQTHISYVSCIGRQALHQEGHLGSPRRDSDIPLK